MLRQGRQGLPDFGLSGSDLKPVHPWVIHMTKKQKTMLMRILVAAAGLIALLVLDHLGTLAALPGLVRLGLYLVPYAVIGWDILAKAVRNILHGQVFDENFLMAVATLAAVGIGEYPEAAAVMLLYQIGELFQSYAVGKSRKSISDLMDIAPEFANLETEDGLEQADPEDVAVGSIIVIKPGERVPLDGTVLSGESLLDTAALTGESVPRRASAGDDVISGCVNGSGTLRVQTTKVYEDSTVSRILELVENASSKKARVETFITRFARIYTPVVTILAVLLALAPPLVLHQSWSQWIRTACIFLVVSCPCALVISVPLGFFGGIGACSKLGVLVKGSNYLEFLSSLRTLVLDKTGTVTKGEFKVARILPQETDEQTLLELAAHGEAYSTHPIAQSIREAYGRQPELSRLGQTQELSGRGIETTLDGRQLLLGNATLMQERSIPCPALESMGTVVYCAMDGRYLGAIEIADSLKPGAAEALAAVKAQGVEQTVMLTGDRREAAELVGARLGIDQVHAELLPGDKVAHVERLLAETGERGKLAFVGDGLNDAPVLSRADVGIAMGSLGSDAAIEAADVVIMDDDIGKIASTIAISKKTMRIVRQNIVFALAVKLLIMVLGVVGLANMWLAVFGDVGVSIIAILNSMRTLRMGKLR